MAGNSVNEGNQDEATHNALAKISLIAYEKDWLDDKIIEVG